MMNDLRRQITISQRILKISPDSKPTGTAAFSMDEHLSMDQMKFDNEDFEEEIYDEDKYDALNDETFGNDMSDGGDWETDHEKYAQFDDHTKIKCPDGTEIDNNLSNSYPCETINDVFSESLKYLPNFDNKVRQLHALNNHYEVHPSLQYQNNLNLINQNVIINLPSDPNMRTIISAPNLNTFVQNNFSVPHEYEFNESNGHIVDSMLCKPTQKVISSPISVADLEKQLIDAVKVNPSHDQHIANINLFLPISPYYKNDNSQYNLPIPIPIRPAPIQKNFPRNNVDSRNLINHVNQHINNAGRQNFAKMKNYISEEFPNNYTDHSAGAGFMTLREKHWLAGIQTIQFNNSNPLEEDFYFTMYQKRHYGSCGPKPNHLFNQTDQLKSHNSYTQLHFENSLGKVQLGNVITPRKTIDIEKNDFIPSNTNTNTTFLSRSLIAQKNSKQILLEIEHMYIPLLKIEQTYYAIRNKLRAAPSAQQFIDELTNAITNHLHHLVLYVTIRKGKQLVHRILPHLKNPSFLWSMFFGPSICSIIAKDSKDQLLLLFLPYIRQWIFCLSLVELNQIAEYLMKNLSFVLVSVFGVSVIANMIERAEEIRTNDPIVLKQWTMFISNIILISSQLTIERPVIGLDRRILKKHLKNLQFDYFITNENIIKFIHQMSFLGDTSKK